nr:hypothetical protein [Paenibacillus sonchi]
MNIPGAQLRIETYPGLSLKSQYLYGSGQKMIQQAILWIMAA